MDSELVKLLDPSLECNGHTIENERIIFHVFSTKESCICPYCGTETTKVHSTYIRNIEDIPIQEHQTVLLLVVSAFQTTEFLIFYASESLRTVGCCKKHCSERCRLAFHHRRCKNQAEAAIPHYKDLGITEY